MKPSLKAETQAELLQKLGRIDVSVPGRTEGRRSDHCETYCICHFLASYAADALLRFPLELVARQSPDFALVMPDGAVGIEVTEAAHEDYSWAMALAEEDPRSVLEPSRFRPGHKIERGHGTKPPVGSLDRPLRSLGCVGNDVERNWTQFVVEAVERKRAKRASPSFERFPSNWLLIYDNTPTMALHLDKAAPMLATALADKWVDSFSAIFVQTGDFSLCMTVAGWRTTSLKKLWPRRESNEYAQPQRGAEPSSADAAEGRSR